MAQTLALINQKGGVGKTTLAANCGAYWGRAGRRVLAIDLDPQAHLSLHYGIAVEDRTLYQVLRGELAFAEVLVPVAAEGVDLVPSSLNLSGAEIELGQELGREMLLRDALTRFLGERPYDVVIIDCPPSLGLLSLNGLTAADDVVIPVQAEFFALQGIAQLISVMEKVQKRLHAGLRWRIIVPTMVDSRTILGREVVADLRAHFPGRVADTCIPKRVKVAEAPSRGQSIFGYAPHSDAASDFEALARELERRLVLFPEARTPASPGSQADAPARSGAPAPETAIR